MRRSAMERQTMARMGVSNRDEMLKKIKEEDARALKSAQDRTMGALKGAKTGKEMASRLKTLGATGMRDYQRNAYNPYAAAIQRKGYAELPGDKPKKATKSQSPKVAKAQSKKKGKK